MKVFVINISDQRWEKYSKDPRYTRFKGVDGNKELGKDWVNQHYHFYWNCNDKLRKSIAGCSESHIKLLKHIRDNKLDNCIILEDDCELDFSRIDELKELKRFTYIGGAFRSPILKNKKEFSRPEVAQGLNKINPKEFVITNLNAYYIPDHSQVDLFLSHSYVKRRAIDVEMVNFQKKGLITDFIYPALGKLYLPDAENGFTWGQSNYKLESDLQFY